MFFKKKTRNESIEKAKKDSSSLGNLLLEMGVTEEDLERALQLQKDNEEKLLGETLIAMGSVSRDVLEFVLEKQKSLRSNGREKTKSISNVIKLIAKQQVICDIEDDIKNLTLKLNSKKLSV